MELENILLSKATQTQKDKTLSYALLFVLVPNLEIWVHNLK